MKILKNVNDSPSELIHEPKQRRKKNEFENCLTCVNKFIYLN